MQRTLLLTLTLGALGALAPLDAAAVPACGLQGSASTITDGSGYVWDIDEVGAVWNGSSDAYDAGMAMIVDGVDFPLSAKVQNGNEVTVGPATLSGLTVTRSVFVSPTTNFARWVDTFANPTGNDIIVSLAYQSNPGADSNFTVFDSSNGNATLETSDLWVGTDDASNGGGDPSLYFNIHDNTTEYRPSSVTTTVFNCFGTQGVGWEYGSLVVPAGKTVGILTVLGQNPDQATASANGTTFSDPSNVMEGITADQRRAVVNWTLPKEILVVSDSTTDENIADALSPFHNVTLVSNGYDTTTQGTTPLEGFLTPYDVVYWSATGTGFGSLNASSPMYANLANWVFGGGRIYVTGYDSIDSPDDPDLALFVGGTGSTADLFNGQVPGPLASIYSSLTYGAVDVRGVTPSDGFTDRDGLTAIAPGTISVATSAGDPNQFQWVIRPLGAGEIAYVSNGATPNNGTFPNGHDSWVDPTSAYNASLLNFALGAGGAATATNVDPVADAGGPYAALAGGTVALDGSASTDSDGTIVLYEWDCENDGTFETSSASPTGDTCSYPAGGTYTVALQVTDDGGATNTATATATIDGPPVADAGGPYLVNQGAPLTVDASASTDAEGAIASYAFDCTDDGIFDTAGASPTATCTYPDVGTYTVRVTVSDGSGQTATATSTVNALNTPPTADAAGPYNGTKGFAVSLIGSPSNDVDGTIVSWDWDCTNDGVVDITASAGTGDTCTYNAVGVYTLGLTVTDDDGATGSTTATVNIGNDPPVANAGGPYSGNEGVAITLDGSASSDPGPVGSIVSYDWDCENDGSFDTSGVSATCTYGNDGTYTVGLTVTDDDGATSTATTTVTVSNTAPVIASVNAPSGDEGVSVSFSATVTDVAADPINYAWDFGDGTTDVGPTPSHTYLDDGTYTVTLTATDDGGASSTATATASIANVDPSLDNLNAPATADEGASVSVTASATDVAGDTADLTYTWSWGDGTADGSGASASHAWDDDGTYTVTVTVDDQDGGTDSETYTVTVANVAPEITSTPAVNAVQGTTYAYTPIVTDPGNETFLWSLSPSASSNVVFDSATGEVTWTPDSADVAQGSWSMTLAVNDGDGGSDAQSWTVMVAAQDTDGDGMSDDFETANGLDPNDPNDAGLDPDLDGLTNLDEYNGGTDPNTYDGPSVPVAVSPLGGAEVADARPDLVIDNAVDPSGDVLTYTFEVYDDAALTSLVTTVTGVAEDASGQTTWEVDLPLTDNAEYWWRAAASDPYVMGAWTTEESFFVNALEEAPTTPVAVYPIDDEVVDSLTPTLTWSESSDADGDPLTYDVEVYDEDGVLVTSTTGVTGDGVSAEWTVDMALTEDAFFDWSVRAADDTGLTSDWTEAEGFFISEVNSGPSDSVFVAPVDGQSLADLSPDLVATEAVDPEGTELIYQFEIDTTNGFDSGDYMTRTLPATDTGTVTWSLSAEFISLPENGTVYARVRAIDEDGVSSVPDTISFFVRGANDAPSVPTLVSPEDGAVGVAMPEFVVEDGVDPEGDSVRIEYIVARDANLSDVVAQSSPLAGIGTTTWAISVELTGDVYWSARALDADDAASDWAEPWAYSVEELGDDDDSAGDDDDDNGTGCDCQNSVAGSGGTSWMLVLLPVAVLLRRRR